MKKYLLRASFFGRSQMEPDSSPKVSVLSFPLSDSDWKQFTEKAVDSFPDKEEQILKLLGLSTSESKDMSPYPFPKEPANLESMNIASQIFAIQKLLNHLQYNHTGTQFFQIKMNRSIARLYDVAKEIIKSSLPIKCLEAVIVSLYLTAKINNLSRFTIRFKSKFGNVTHRHIVLGLYSNSLYGALGLSRRKSLMYKPLAHKSLTDLILDYKSSYEECCHELRKVKMSLPISNDIHSCDRIVWNFFSIAVWKMKDDEIRSSLERFSRELRTKSH